MLHNVKNILKVTWLCSLRQVKHQEMRPILNKFETLHVNMWIFLLKYSSVTKIVKILFSSP